MTNRIASFMLTGLIVCTTMTAGCAGQDKSKRDDKTAAGATSEPTKSLKIEDLTLGTGEKAMPGRLVTVHYTGWLTDGTVFDSSRDRGEPFEFQLGGGQVIQGWEQGVVGMKVGGTRRLTVPARLGYGKAGMPGKIPADAPLIFEIELLDVS